MPVPKISVRQPGRHWAAPAAWPSSEELGMGWSDRGPESKSASGAAVVVGVQSGPRYLLSALGFAVLQEGIAVGSASSPAPCPPAQGGASKAEAEFVMSSDSSCAGGR